MKIMQLLLACSSVCLVKASVSLVKLGDRSVPRPLLILAKDSRQKTAMAIQRLKSLSECLDVAGIYFTAVVE